MKRNPLVIPSKGSLKSLSKEEKFQGKSSQTGSSQSSQIVEKELTPVKKGRYPKKLITALAEDE